jgi:hypothetical protein
MTFLNLLFLPRFPGAPKKRGLLLPRRAAAFWEGARAFGEEPRKQKPRSSRTQELPEAVPRKKSGGKETMTKRTKTSRDRSELWRNEGEVEGRPSDCRKVLEIERNCRRAPAKMKGT